MLGFWLQKGKKIGQKLYVVGVRKCWDFGSKKGKTFGQNSYVVSDIGDAPILAPKKAKKMGKISM